MFVIFTFLCLDNVVRKETNECVQMLPLKVTRFLHVLFWSVLSQHMTLQMARLFEGVVALLAGKRFLAGVCKHVALHRTGETARVVALVACKGLLPSMCEHVALEMMSLNAGIVALLTPERLLT